MENFFNALSQSVKSENWYAALALSLTIPDICSTHHQGSNSKEKFINWLGQYFLDSYKGEVSGKDHVFLSGDDFYALRCVYLHKGSSTISGAPARAVLDKFSFRVPRKGSTVHKNTIDLNGVKCLQLQVDIFSNEVLEASKEWWSNQSVDIKNKINEKLIEII